MNVTYDVPVPKKNNGSGHKWADLIHDFIDSDHDSMCVTVNDGVEANCAAMSFRHAIVRQNLNVSVIRRNTSVYLVKGGDK